MIITGQVPDTDPGIAPPHAVAKLAILAGGNIMTTLMISSVLPATGAIARHFSTIGNADLRAQFILLAPYISFIFASPLSGVLIQKCGRRWPLLAVFALYAVAGGAELFIDSFWPLAIARIALGAAGGAITTIVMTLAGDYFTGAKRTWAVTIVGLAPALGAVAAIGVSGILVDRGGWHMAFAPYLISIPILISAFFIITEPTNLSHAAAESAALPKNFLGLCVVTMAVACLAVMAVVQLPFLMADIGVHSATLASMIMLVSTIVAVASAFMYPVLRRYLSVNNVLVFLLGCSTICFLLLSLSKTLVVVTIALLIAGPPSGLMITHFSAVTIERVSPAARGRGLGLINSSISLGQLLIPFVTEPLRVGLGIQPMFGVLAIVVFIAGLGAYLAPSLRAKRPPIVAMGGSVKPPSGLT
jgi:MFS family permease